MLFSALDIEVPNGGEEWRINQEDTVRWVSIGFEGAVKIELNRDYPTGTWEVLADSTENDGEEVIQVTEPPSDSCRVRISTLSDTLTDVSDADFRIVAHLALLSPNGGEEWGVFETDTVRWEGGGFDSVHIELNRDYPDGLWEVLFDSTENDGVEPVFVAGGLSDNCRVRIKAMDGAMADTSDTDFSIVAVLGYLALVRPSEPDLPVENWDAGTVECPETTSDTFRLKNFGDSTIVVFQPEPLAGPDFSRVTDCSAFFGLAGGEMSTCEVILTFDPLSEGVKHDTLLIQTNAANGDSSGYIHISLAGEQIRTPAAPQVVISIEGEDARLMWDPVTQSIGGCPITVDRYLVYYSPTSEGPYYYHGYTSDTTYVHLGVVTYEENQFYEVEAWVGPVAILDAFPAGDRDMTREEVRRMLRESSRVLREE